MKRKKIITYFLCIVLLVSLAGCSGKDINASKRNSSKETLTYNCVEIAGNIYDMAQEPETVIGQMVENGLLVWHPQSEPLMRLYSADGQIDRHGDTLRIQQEGVSVWDSPKNEKYFDDNGELKAKYQGKVVEAYTDTSFYIYNDDKRNLYYDYWKYFIRVYSSYSNSSWGGCSFKISDGITENTTPDMLDSEHYVHVGKYSNYSQLGVDNIYVGVIADGKFIDLSAYENEFNKYENMNVSDFRSEFYPKGKQGCGYGEFIMAQDSFGFSPSVTIGELAQEDQDLYNICLVTLALSHCAEQLENGEIDSAIAVTYSYGDRDERVEMRWDVYMRD